LVTSSLFPAIVNAKKISEALYLQRLQRLYTFMIWMAISIAIPMTFLNEWLIVLLYGEAYRAAGQVLEIHIWAGVFVFLGVGFGRYLITENMTKIYFYRTATGAFLNIILNYFLIPFYGISGAAISTLLAQAITNYVYDIFNKELHQQLKLKTKAIVSPQTIFR
jgi:O-antigen/teichoic acid export membrane protein